jgi:transposase
MEDVLDLYAEPYDAQRPVVNFDEKPVQLLEDVRDALAAKPGQSKREDYEYKRQGTVNLFIAFEAHVGHRAISVTERRSAQDFAAQMQALVAQYPQAEVIRVVLDNLSSHSPAALYQSLRPAEARALTRRLEFHFTPKHGSWLNMAEVEWSVFERQCLGRRIGSLEELRAVAEAWTSERNARKACVDWRFSTEVARVKFERLYATFEKDQ